MNRRHFALLLGSAVLLGTAAYAQGPQSPTAQDSKQKASQAAPAMDFKAWRTPTDPFHIVGPIYYVGTSGISVYLITTPAGHILLNGAIPGTALLIEASIRKLGYKPEDIRILLISHAHFDHVGTLADLQKLTGAKVEVMQQDVDLLKSGGALDYLWANDARFHFPPVTADVALHDGDTVSLGGVTLTAHLTPGHTPGTTTWVTTVEDGGRSYVVAFPDGTNLNPGTRLVSNPSYPGIADDYRHTFSVLESLHPDIFLSYHPEFFDLTGKRARMGSEGVHAWVDPEGYKRQIAAKKAVFEEWIAKESSGAHR